MKLVEYVPDYVLRDLPLKIGMTVTILKGAKVRVQLPRLPTQHEWEYELGQDIQATLSNFLPGYTEVYAPHAVHNHQVVWITNNTTGEPWQYHSTDINNVKEVRDAH
jgi:hypothetical protein